MNDLEQSFIRIKDAKDFIARYQRAALEIGTSWRDILWFNAKIVKPDGMASNVHGFSLNNHEIIFEGRCVGNRRDVTERINPTNAQVIWHRTFDKEGKKIELMTSFVSVQV